MVDESDARAIALGELSAQLSRIDNQVSSLARDVESIYATISHMRSQLASRTTTTKKRTRDESARTKQEVLGKLPLMLLDKNLLPTNESLRKFAETIGMSNSLRPLGRESRAEIIGMILVEVASLPEDQMIRMRNAIDGLLQKKTQSPSNFIREWENVIKSFRFER